MTAYLLDANIWLRSVQREAPQHPLADVTTRRYFLTLIVSVTIIRE
jgi:hypothetical protein